ncbi:TIR domain-containing protein [Acinetobacter sp. 1125_18A]|uniref:TIR domain-containing protein n=1 Tax=Acinetobacter sp. 1125_18A TaxID=2605959 RepID=UPI004058D0A2
MKKDQLLSILQKLKERLDSDVRQAYYRDDGTGEERLTSWMKFAKKQLDPFSTEIYEILQDKPSYRVAWSLDGSYHEGHDFDQFKRTPILAYLDSLILDVENDEFDFAENKIHEVMDVKQIPLLRKVFIVHGHDDTAKLGTARLLEKLGFEAIILHEQASKGKTIIEKLEEYTDVGFGIILYTPDDVGETKTKKNDLRPRARQNVVFEHGLLIGKLGRERVFPLVTDNSIELPNDISGVVYMSERNWEIDLAKEIRMLGYEIDINKLIS